MKTSKNDSKKQFTLKELFVNRINVLYDVENQIIKALPKMIKASTNINLKNSFITHLEQTNNHAYRLERIQILLEIKSKKIKSEAIRGIIEDAKGIIDSITSPEALDANLVRAAQYIEHYEIAGYNGAIAWAEMLNEDEVVKILKETFDEEIIADETLEIIGKNLDILLLGREITLR